MIIGLQSRQHFDCPPADVFALVLDPQRFPAMFRGFGPIPSIRRIELLQAPAVGATRRLENSDGSTPVERITALDPPRHHAYTLSGLAPPFSWLVRCGHADWRLQAVDRGTDVTWEYRFELTSALAWPLAAPVLNWLMATAMRRCLAAMAASLSAREAIA